MARPRTHSDEDFFAAAHAAVMELGGRATLADIAARAGVTPAALVRRFGNKRAFLVRLSERWIAGLDVQLEAAERGVADPTERLEAVAVSGLVELDDGARAAHQLSALADDLQDEELTALLATGYERTRDRLRTIMEEPQVARALPGSPPAHEAADLLHAMVHGTALLWSLRPTGSLVEVTRARVRAVIAPWRSTVK